jgi:Uma2 family endonuclease
MISIQHSQPTDEEIFRWGDANPGYRFEYVNGELLIVSPTTGKTGIRQSALSIKLGLWARAFGYYSFGSDTLFHFGSVQVSPDEALITKVRFDALPEPDKDKVVTLIPDIVVELISKSQGFGKTRGGVVPKCEAMRAEQVGYVLMLDPYAQGTDRIMEWGTRPANFPTDWDDVLDA